MIEHKNPCKAIRSNPFLRKESQITQSMTPKQSVLPIFEESRKEQEGDIWQPPGDKQNTGKNKNPQYFSHKRIASQGCVPCVQNSVHRIRKTMTDASTHVPSPNIFQTALNNLSQDKKVLKDLKFLRQCYELAASQNQCLITHVSARHKSINQLDVQIEEIRRLSRMEKRSMEMELSDLDTIMAADSGEEESRNNTPRMVSFIKQQELEGKSGQQNETHCQSGQKRKSKISERRSRLLRLKAQLQNLNFERILDHLQQQYQIQ